jgi:hypothetical protein
MSGWFFNKRTEKHRFFSADIRRNFSQEYLDDIITRLKMIDIVSAVFEIVPEKQKKTWNLPPE